VCAVLYEILTGWPPLYREAAEAGLIDGRTGAAVHVGQSDALWRLMVGGSPIPPIDLVDGLPSVVSHFVMRGLSIDPADRTTGPDAADAQSALAALTAIQHQVRSAEHMHLGRLVALKAPRVSPPGAPHYWRPAGQNLAGGPAGGPHPAALPPATTSDENFRDGDTTDRG
jgi:hypothetical protein